jgi:hypothetical protein
LDFVSSFRNSKCQNASIDGCGGFGNNWSIKLRLNINCYCFSLIFSYYCDICESLKGIDERRDSNGIPAGIAEKLRGWGWAIDTEWMGGIMMCLAA